MNKAANAIAEAIYSTTDADGVLVTFDHTLVVTGTHVTRYQPRSARSSSWRFNRATRSTRPTAPTTTRKCSTTT
jgi:hypothetical protein